MTDPAHPWWRDAVIYQVYPRSFQDSDGDGVGDLAGIASRLEYLSWLGVDALWLSPIYPSPQADSGYDISDHEAIDPVYGSLEDFDRLVAEADRHGLRVLMDLVPSHTSIEHPWFREHPDWYVWAEGKRDGPPNNWRSAFGGPAWSRGEDSEGKGNWYLHSFYPEQPDLDWRNPEVREAMGEVIRFWRRRGVEGFRIDAIERVMKDALLRDDPPAGGPPPLPMHPDPAGLESVHSRNDPEIGLALAAMREAAGDAVLIGEVYLPSASLGPYLEHLDLAFAFEFLHAPWRADRLAEVIAAAARLDRVAWVLSNHDFRRLVSRLGEEAARAAALLLLTLPGAAFVYQGEEIGMEDGSDQGIDRVRRDRFRHPMQWDASPGGGFSTGDPWLEPSDPERRAVATQRDDPGSLLALYRRLIALRRELRGPLEPLPAPPGLLVFRRGEHAVAINFNQRAAESPLEGELLLATHPDAESAGARVARTIPPSGGIVVRLQRV